MTPAKPNSTAAVRTDPSSVEPLPAPNGVFVVAEGETLSRIAARLDVSVPELVRLNRLADPDRLDVGQELVVPWSVAAQLISEPGARQPIPPEVPPEPLALQLIPPEAGTQQPIPPAPRRPADGVSRGENAEAQGLRHERALRRLRIDLELARSAYHGADFEGALSITHYLSAVALELAPLPSASRLGSEASFLRGAIRVGLGDPDEATCDFAHALALGGGYEPNLSEISPKVIAVFRNAEALGPRALSACASLDRAEGAAPSLGARLLPSTEDRP